MTDWNDVLAHLLLKQTIEDFLYHEAELLAERRYEEWLELLADDVRYWMPMRRNVKFGELEREFTREGQDIPNTALNPRQPRTIAVWHPRGPHQTEVWRWYLVDHDAPSEVKNFLRQYYIRYSGPGG